MQSKVYIDTNIVIDICDKNRSFYDSSRKIVESLLANGVTLYINSDTFSNLFYILSKQSVYTNEEILNKLLNIYEIFTLVITSELEIENSIKLCANTDRPFKDYEDALQYICAKKIEADFIVTNDKKFISPDIEVRGSAV